MQIETWDCNHAEDIPYKLLQTHQKKQITSHWGIVGRRPSALLAAKHTRAEWNMMACFLLKPHFWLFKSTPMLHSTVFSLVQGCLSEQLRLKQKKARRRTSTGRVVLLLSQSGEKQSWKPSGEAVSLQPYTNKDLCTEELLLHNWRDAYFSTQYGVTRCQP